MNGKRVFLTGATGFLGRHIARALSREGAEIVALTRDQKADDGLSQCLHAEVHGVLDNLNLLERAIAQYEISLVIALAAQTDVRIAYSEPFSTWESNVKGAYTLLEACRRRKVNRIIFASSDKGYGLTPPPYKESDPLRASFCYESSKACADLIAQSYEKTFDMSVAITRCGNFFGGGRLNWSTLIPGTIKSILEGKKPVLRSDGTMRRDFLYIDDAVSAYLALVKSDARGAFNFGTGHPLKVIDVVNEICEAMNWCGGIEILDEAQGEIVDQYLDTTRARKELGWTPRVTFREGLERTIAWYREFLR